MLLIISENVKGLQTSETKAIKCKLTKTSKAKKLALCGDDDDDSEGADNVVGGGYDLLSRPD